MATWIALLRGINVLGRNKVSRVALSAALGVEATARNGRTVTQLIEMARGGAS